jgi:cell division inhibitor SepF
MLVYFGIAEEADVVEPDEEERVTRSSSQRRTASRRTFDADADEPVSRSATTSRRAPRSRSSASSNAGHGVAGVGVVPPRTFNDAQKIADLFKDGRPVIVNLQASDAELSKRIIDFASGLTYGLDGSMQRIADRVFLLTPPDVDVSAEDRAALLESGFFNQS